MLQLDCLLLLLAVLGLIIIGVVIYLRGETETPVKGDTPMTQRRITVLTFYLLLFGVGLVFMLVSLTALDFPETAVAPLEAPIPVASPAPTIATSGPVTTPPTPPSSPAPTPVPTPVVPILIRVFPQVTVGSTPNERLAVYGKNFNNLSKVRFNLEPLPTEFYSDDLIRVRLEPADLVGKGSITVDVINPDGAISNAIPVPIEKPQVKLNLFFIAYPDVTREVQLLLLVIFAGALGSYLHAIMSIADYVAKRDLEASYFWWYISRPFLGMAMALVFYAVLRGGFLAGTPADANVVNPFGVLTVGALVGMFSYKAAQKLGEIFDVVFKATAPNQEAGIPLISKLVPNPVPAGGAAPVRVKLIGSGLSRVSTVLLDTDKNTPDTANEKVVYFYLDPKDMVVPRDIKVSLVTSDGAISDTAILTIGDGRGGPPPQGDNGESASAEEDETNNGEAAVAGNGEIAADEGEATVDAGSGEAAANGEAAVAGNGEAAATDEGEAAADAGSGEAAANGKAAVAGDGEAAATDEGEAAADAGSGEAAANGEAAVAGNGEAAATDEGEAAAAEEGETKP